MTLHAFFRALVEFFLLIDIVVIIWGNVRMRRLTRDLAAAECEIIASDAEINRLDDLIEETRGGLGDAYAVLDRILVEARTTDEAKRWAFDILSAHNQLGIAELITLTPPGAATEQHA